VPFLYYAMPVEGKDCLGRSMEMEFYVDITEYMEQKAELLACHASQRDWLMKHHKVDEYIEQMKRWSAQAGSRIGVAFAEGFLQHRGHAYPQDNRLIEILEGYGV
jgi:N-acetylglucosamine malate deacetylase 1